MFDVAHIIQNGGLALVALLIFAESGMFVGFFFPGDTLLISAGIFAGQGKLSLINVIVVVALAAIAGDNTGYAIGKKFGRKLFSKPDSVLFSPQHLHQAEAFFERFGSRSMLLAHFVPIVRTFAPPVAGTAGMNRRNFIIFDAIGDTAWAIIMTVIGYTVGTRIPNIDRYIMIVVGVVVLATILPASYHFIKTKRHIRAAKTKSKNSASDSTSQSED